MDAADRHAAVAAASIASADVIFGVESIRAPLTGIGRYALELAKGLSGHQRIDRLRLYSAVGWVKDPTAFLSQAPASRPGAGKFVRSRLPVLRAYQAVRFGYARWTLREERQALFHSPSFILPAFPGRTVATVHDLSHVRFPEFHPAPRVAFLHRALPESLGRASMLITGAESVRQEIIDYFGWPPDRIRVIHHGVDTFVFRPRTTTELTAALSRVGLLPGSYTLFVGTIEPRKNLERLLDAYEALPGTVRRRWPLVLGGSEGWLSAGIHAKIQKAAEAGWCRYLRYVPHELLPHLYSGSRLFVYPSLYEGFGLPALEAMASGVPVVVSDTSSLPEVVGEAALLVDPLDTDALADAMRQGLEDAQWRTAAVAAGLARARGFAWETSVERTVSVYERALGL